MKKYKKVVIILLFLLVAVFIYFNSRFVFMNPFAVTYGDIVYATLDGEGNQIVIDSSGQRLVKVNADSQVTFIVKGAMQSGKGFYEAKKVITDQDNNIYVLNILKEEGSYRIKREEILKYSPEGKYQGIVCSIDHEPLLLTEEIVGLFNVGGNLSYIRNEENAFTIYDQNNNPVHTYVSDNTRQLTVSYAISPVTGEICYSTKQGHIYRYQESGEDILLYDANTSEYLSVPRCISFDPEGRLYFTDIGLRTVSVISRDGTVSHEIYDGTVGEDTADKYIYYYCDASNGVIAVTSDYTIWEQDGEIQALYGSDWSYSTGLRVQILAVWAALLILAAISAWLLIRIGFYIFAKGPKIFRIAAGVIAGVGCIAGIFLMIVLPDFEGRLLDAVLQRAQVISDVTVMQLPLEEFKSLDSTSDFMGEEYLAVRNQINKLYLSDNEGIEDFYCVLYTVRDNVITCNFALQEDSGAVYPYDWSYEGSDEQWIIENKEGMVYESSASSEGSYLFVLNPIIDENGEVAGLIEVGTDLNSFQRETNRMILDLLLHIIAITTVVVLIAWEIIIFYHGRSEYKKNRLSRLDGGMIQIPIELYRILVFGIFFITNMTTSFLPLYAMDIAEQESLLALPREILAAIPISAEVLFGAIFSIAGNVVIKHLGHKKSAALGSLLFTGGLFVRFIATSIWVLTLGNAIMGSGWGILLLLVNTVIAMGDEEEKNKGFSGYSAAALNGVNCGIVFGGFLVNWLNYTTIFMIAAFLSILVVFHVISYLNKAVYTNNNEPVVKEEQSMSLGRFLTSKGIIGFFLMIVIPVIACSYFLNYLYPILGNEYGLSETKVGYSFLINGLCVICFSNFLTEYLSKKLKKTYSLVLSSLLYAAAFLCVAYFQNIYSLIAVLILLGISDSFGLPLQTSYFTDLEAVKKYGYEKSMGIYSLFENLSQSGGSFVFSYVLLMGVSEGLYIVLIIVAGLAILFGLINLIRDRQKKVQTLQ